MRGPVARLLELIDLGESPAAVRFVLDHQERTGSVASALDDILRPAQLEAGERWHRADWTVAQEHAATAVVDDALGMLSFRLPPPTGDKTVVVVCAEQEWHLTPARMAAIVLRDGGWRVRFLGGSIPGDHLRRTLEATPVDVVVVSCTLPLALPGAAATVAAVHDVGLPVVAGGRAFGVDDRWARRLGAHGWAPTAEGAVELLDTWLDRPPADVVPAPFPAAYVDLESSRADVLDGAFLALSARFPAMADYGGDQLERTREDLDYILRFLAVSVFLDDRTVLTEFLEWLERLLAARGVPRAALDAGITALAEELAPELAAVLRHA